MYVCVFIHIFIIGVPLTYNIVSLLTYNKGELTWVLDILQFRIHTKM